MQWLAGPEEDLEAGLQRVSDALQVGLVVYSLEDLARRRFSPRCPCLHTIALLREAGSYSLVCRQADSLAKEKKVQFVPHVIFDDRKQPPSCHRAVQCPEPGPITPLSSSLSARLQACKLRNQLGRTAIF
jgi:hypothetical protein